jgi:hypothetical protein
LIRTGGGPMKMLCASLAAAFDSVAVDLMSLEQYDFERIAFDQIIGTEFGLVAPAGAATVASADVRPASITERTEITGGTDASVVASAQAQAHGSWPNAVDATRRPDADATAARASMKRSYPPREVSWLT